MSDVATNEIRAALAKLDAKNDDHWTEQGAPRLDALGLAGKPSRQEVTAAAPLFNRANPVLPSDSVDALTQAGEVQVEQPKRLDADELEFLELEVAEADKEVLAQTTLVDQAKGKLQAAQHKRDELIRKMDVGSASRARTKNMEGIKAVLERGKAERAAKAELAAELRKAGITQKLLQAGSPLDQAMARKRAFGTQRPNLSTR